MLIQKVFPKDATHGKNCPSIKNPPYSITKKKHFPMCPSFFIYLHPSAVPQSCTMHAAKKGKKNPSHPISSQTELVQKSSFTSKHDHVAS